MFYKMEREFGLSRGDGSWRGMSHRSIGIASPGADLKEKRWSL